MENNQLLAVQKPDGIYLRGNGIDLFTDDPTVKVGDLVNEEEYDVVCQEVDEDDMWADCSEGVYKSHYSKGINCRQILRRKAEGEKDVEKVNVFHDMTDAEKTEIINGFTEITAKEALKLFMMCGLKTHFAVKVVNDYNGEEFELSFKKIESI